VRGADTGGIVEYAGSRLDPVLFQFDITICVFLYMLAFAKI
jgi:hypothetical protein